MGAFQSFIDLNVAVSRRLDARNLSEYGAHVEYLRLCALLFSAPDVGRVLDVASGQRWHFPKHYKQAYSLHVTGIDIDADAVTGNTDLDEAIVGNVCEPGALGGGNYDLITCYSGIEHFPDVETFLGNAFASLRDGGALIAQFPSSLAPFALLNRALPQSLKRYLVERLAPGKRGEIGYPAKYDKCVYSAFREAAERVGFDVEYYLPSYMSSGYFYPFFPVFLVSQVADYARLMFGSRDMASYNLFVLRKPGEHFQIKWSWHTV